MDGRERMALPGSAPYYLHGGINVGNAAAGGGGSGSSGSAAHTAFNTPLGFRNLSTPTVHQAQTNFRGASSSAGSSTFNVEGSPASFPPIGFTVTVASASDGGGGGAAAAGGSLNRTEPGKKKRGRPRKYGPNGSVLGAASGAEAVSLGLSPLSSPDANASSEKRKRGRPPGSGRKQRLASVGEWMSSSAGIAFTPHVIYVAPGEDIASKILSFSQQKPRALCIMSASGGVSAVTLCQPASSVGNATYEGRFEILCLSGSYLVAETGGAQNRTGGVNVSLSSPDGQVIGGSVAGRLIASRPVQVVVCSFAYGNPKAANPKPKADTDPKGEKSSPVHHTADNGIFGPVKASPSQHNNPANIVWPGSKALEGRNLNTDIDLMRD